MADVVRETVVLVDLTGRRQPIRVLVTVNRFIAALPQTIGGFVFDRTEDRTPDGYPIFRQADPARPANVIDAAAVKAALES